LGACHSNIFAELPAALSAEVFETLATGSGIRIERIVSHAHSSPDGFWYDQPQSEWLLLLAGAARLEFEGREIIELKRGSYLNIPAHLRHRVLWTDPTQLTIWLAVHYAN